MDKKSVIVYGLGKAYKNQRYFIENEFHVVGYSDKDKKDFPLYIPPEEISGKKFDYIYVTSNIFFEEIKTSILEASRGGISPDRIISVSDILGDFQNEAVRRNWIIGKISQIPDGSILLDAGAGEMKYEKYCNRLKYIAQDFGKYSPEECDKGLKGKDIWDTSRVNILCDIVDMPIEDNTIDAVLCSEVFEHLKNPVLALKEFSRVIKPGGILLLTAPFSSMVHMAPYHFASGFSEFWYYEHMKDYGFEIKEIKPYGNYFKWISQELFRTNEMAARYCSGELNRSDIKTITDCIKLMSRLSMEDRESDSALCFGYLVEGRKL